MKVKTVLIGLVAFMILINASYAEVVERGYDYTQTCYDSGICIINMIPNYLNQGVWTPTNTNIEVIDNPSYSWAVTENNFEVYFKDNPGNKQIRIIDDGLEIAFKNWEQGQFQNIVIDENKITYVYNSGNNLTFEVFHDKIKETITFPQYPNKNIFSFKLQTDATPELINNELYFEGDSFLGFFKQPYLIDAEGNTEYATLTMRTAGQNIFMDIEVDDAWLQSAVYPVVLDPTYDDFEDASINTTLWDTYCSTSGDISSCGASEAGGLLTVSVIGNANPYTNTFSGTALTQMNYNKINISGINQTIANITSAAYQCNCNAVSGNINISYGGITAHYCSQGTCTGGISSKCSINNLDFIFTKINSTHWQFQNSTGGVVSDIGNFTINESYGLQLKPTLTKSTTSCGGSYQSYINVEEVNYQGDFTTYEYLFDNCTNTSTQTLNFYLEDELNGTSISGDLDFSITYWKSSRNSNKTYTLTQENTNSFMFCMDQSWMNLSADYSAVFNAEGYQQRSIYKADIILSSSLTNTSLLMTPTSEGIYARFRSVDQYSNVITSVNSEMYNDENILIETGITDDGGMVTFWVSPDETYTFTFEKTGYETRSITIRPTSTDIYNVQLNAEEAEQEESIGSGVIYSFSVLPDDQILINNSNYNFSFDMSSGIHTITDCQSTLYDENLTQLAQSSSSYTNTTCNITIQYNSGGYDTIYNYVRVEQNNTINITYKKAYSSANLYVGQFSLQNFLNSIKNFADGGFDDFTRMIIAFMIIVGVTIGVIGAANITSTQPEKVMIIVWIMVFIFSYLEWFTINYYPIPTNLGLQQYLIFYLITLLMIGIMMWRNK